MLQIRRPAVCGEFNRESHEASDVYNFTLTPPPASRYLVANVTVTNAHHTEIPFTYGDFVLVARDGHAYYANYAVCNTGYSPQALANRMLHGSFPKRSLRAVFDPISDTTSTAGVHGS
jgi:hypothetical protein